MSEEQKKPGLLELRDQIRGLLSLEDQLLTRIADVAIPLENAVKAAERAVNSVKELSEVLSGWSTALLRWSRSLRAVSPIEDTAEGCVEAHSSQSERFERFAKYEERLRKTVRSLERQLKEVHKLGLKIVSFIDKMIESEPREIKSALKQYRALVDKVGKVVSRVQKINAELEDLKKDFRWVRTGAWFDQIRGELVSFRDVLGGYYPRVEGTQQEAGELSNRTEEVREKVQEALEEQKRVLEEAKQRTEQLRVHLDDLVTKVVALQDQLQRRYPRAWVDVKGMEGALRAGVNATLLIADRVLHGAESVIDIAEGELSRLADVGAHLEGARKTVEELRKGVEDLTTEIGDLVERVRSEVEERLKELGEHFGAAEPHLNTYGDRALSLIDAATTIRDAVKSAAEKLEEIASMKRMSLKRIKPILDALASDARTLDSTLKSLGKTLDRSLSEIKKASSAFVEEVEKAVSDLRELFKDLGDAVRSIQGRAQQLVDLAKEAESSLSDIAKELGRALKEVRDSEEKALIKLEELRMEVEEAAARGRRAVETGLRRSLEALQEARIFIDLVESVEEWRRGLEARILEQTRATLPEVEMALNELRQSIEDLKVRVASLETAFEGLERRIEDAAKQTRSEIEGLVRDSLEEARGQLQQLQEQVSSIRTSHEYLREVLVREFGRKLSKYFQR